MNTTTVFGPPPVGVNLNDNRISQDNAIVAVLCVFAILTVVMRYFVRLYLQGTRLEADDFLIGASIVLLIVLLSMTILGGRHGLGRHVWSITSESMITMKKSLFAYVLIYLAELLLIKVSILMFYRRIFSMNWMIWTCLVISCCWCAGSMVAALSAPRPVSYFWTEVTEPSSGRYRYDFYYYYIGNATANMVTDVLILIAPLPIVWKLQMRIGQKIEVCSLFLLGGFVCVASIVRIHYLTFLHHNVDITWTLSEVSVWSTVEPCIGIICACLPTLQPFIRSITRKLPGQHRGAGRASSVLERNTSPRQPSSSKNSHRHGMWHGQEQEGNMSLKTFFIAEDDCMRLTALSTRV
ncbi:uncharacterized protein N7506_008165 [Penicillium brevicompactum]|uniref:uncharacterized protein n=1 Tax=Penicillium brevicompactum TaxID=5074 RepID=UPI00253F9853|nr:uncharacterized protein N7506_008165 [Penicillium brevicompactum]KAJ5334382.1 hypothetical protein N7506_008165 [Penicillium brevicompactum]